MRYPVLLLFYLFFVIYGFKQPFSMASYCEISVQDDDDGYLLCLGLLASKDHIITAAHCLVELENFSPEKVNVACHNKEISEFRHASFPLDKNNTSMSKELNPDTVFKRKLQFNDIAILRLKEPMNRIYPTDIFFEKNYNRDNHRDPLFDLINKDFVLYSINNNFSACFLMKPHRNSYERNIKLINGERGPMATKMKDLKLSGFSVAIKESNDRLKLRNIDIDSELEQPGEQRYMRLLRRKYNFREVVVQSIMRILTFFNAMRTYPTTGTRKTTFLLTFDNENGEVGLGFSGSPLVCKTLEGRWKAIGLVTSVSGDADNGELFFVELFQNYRNWPPLRALVRPSGWYGYGRF